MNTRRLAAGRVLSLTVAACGLSAGGPPAAPAASPDSTVSPTPSPSPRAQAELCVGPESAAIDLPQVVRQYLAAWNEHDTEARVRILDDIWADDATYLESAGPIGGWAAAHPPKVRLLIRVLASRPSSAWIEGGGGQADAALGAVYGQVTSGFQWANMPAGL